MIADFLLDLFILIVVVIVICSIYHRQKFCYYIYKSTIDSTFDTQVQDIITASAWNTKYNLVRVFDESSADTTIELSHRSELDKHHRNTEYYPSGMPIRFSMTIRKKINSRPRIYIDDINWLYSVPESKLSIGDYRKYVITHELGHALGYDHQRCDDTTSIKNTCPVMYQATRGCNTYNCGTDVLSSDWLNKL